MMIILMLKNTNENEYLYSARDVFEAYDIFVKKYNGSLTKVLKKLVRYILWPEEIFISLIPFLLYFVTIHSNNSYNNDNDNSNNNCSN